MRQRSILLLLLFAFSAAACGDSTRYIQAGSPCSEGDSCGEGLICDSVSNLCRSLLRCQDIACAERQACVAENPSAGLDARCTGECDPGFRWDDAAERCREFTSSCDAQSPVSILDECAAINQSCVAIDEGSAACGACLAGYVLDNGSCRTIETCMTLGCADQNRDCSAETESADAACLGCEEGALFDDLGNCIRQTCDRDANGGSLLSLCEAQNRLCTTIGDGAECGACFFTHEDVGGSCAPIAACENLDCSADNRHCDVAAGVASCGDCLAGFAGADCLPDATADCDAGAANSIATACADTNQTCDQSAGADSCGDCLAGFYFDSELDDCVPSVDCSLCAADDKVCEDDGAATQCGACLPGFKLDLASGDCAPTIPCADITCPGTDICNEGGDNDDAFCQTDCGGGAVFDGSVCVSCPSCTRPGEVGIEPNLTATNQCICETEPGFFYSLGGTIGAFECDADGDGWTRSSARSALESGDPVLVENARCDVREIENFVLVNELGHSRSLANETPVAMFESVRNDDDLALEVFWDQFNLPIDFDPSFVDVAGATCSSDFDCAANSECRSGQCTSIARPSASSLTPLTKLCHSALTDYNDNGVADANEFGAQVIGGLSADKILLNEFSYFAEMHQGRFEPSVGTPLRGDYVIVERSRSAGGTVDRIGLDYGPIADTWRTCTVRRDTRFDQFEEPVGMDFATVTPEPLSFLLADTAEGAPTPWRGMNHHSQFKCLVVTAQPDVQRAQEVSPAQAASALFVRNTCRLASEVAASDDNPSHLEFVCGASSDEPVAGDVGWAAVTYQPYEDSLGDVDGDLQPDGYVLGCTNGCSDALMRAGFDNFDCPHGLNLDDANQNSPLLCQSSPADGALACVEVCRDGLDNDGDGPIDEVAGIPLGAFCDTGLPGSCAAGTRTCTEGIVVCAADTLPPAGTPDGCDGVDNDCDGIIDEDVSDVHGNIPYALATVGGNVGDACAVGLPDGEITPPSGPCDTGEVVCRPVGAGVSALVCGQTIAPQPLDICDGIDNDCSLATVDGSGEAGFGTSCNSASDVLNGVGVCAVGTLTCNATDQPIPLTCSSNGPDVLEESLTGSSVVNSSITLSSFTFQGTVILERAQYGNRDVRHPRCDGLDNDCDGSADEGSTCYVHKLHRWTNQNYSFLHNAAGTNFYDPNTGTTTTVTGELSAGLSNYTNNNGDLRFEVGIDGREGGGRFSGTDCFVGGGCDTLESGATESVDFGGQVIAVGNLGTGTQAQANLTPGNWGFRINATEPKVARIIESGAVVGDLVPQFSGAGAIDTAAGRIPVGICQVMGDELSTDIFSLQPDEFGTYCIFDEVVSARVSAQ